MQREREISIKSIVLYVLKGWRSIVLCMLVLGLALGVMQYRTDRANAMASQNVVVQTPVDIMKNMSADDLSEVKMALNYKTYFDNAKKYVDNSILLKLDHTNVDVAKVQFGITTDDMTNASAFTQAYIGYVESGKLAEEIVAALGLEVEPQYLSEVITVSTLSYTEDAYGNLDEGVVVLTIRYTDETGLKEIVAAAEKQMALHEKEVVSQIGNHKLELQSENVSKLFEQTLIKMQMERIDYYNVTLSGYTRFMAGIDGNQLAVLNSWDAIQAELQAEKTEENVENAPTESAPISVGINVKMIVLGMIAGAFVAVIAKLMIFVGTAKVRSEADIKTAGIRLLGVKQLEGKKAQIGKPIDQLLYKIENGGANSNSTKEQLGMIGSNIYLYCQNENISKIVLTSCAKGNMVAAELEQIKELLVKEGIQAEVSGNVAYNAEALRLASEVKHIVFVESTLKSDFAELCKAVELCQDNGISVAGGVLLN